MNTKKSLLVGAALTSLLAVGALGSPAVTHAGETVAGQCHGVNACKGKGWVKLSKVDCEKTPKGHWKPMPEKH